jgi:hypothetical protein
VAQAAITTVNAITGSSRKRPSLTLRILSTPTDRFLLAGFYLYGRFPQTAKVANGKSAERYGAAALSHYFVAASGSAYPGNVRFPANLQRRRIPRGLANYSIPRGQSGIDTNSHDGRTSYLPFVQLPRANCPRVLPTLLSAPRRTQALLPCAPPR